MTQLSQAQVEVNKVKSEIQASPEGKYYFLIHNYYLHLSPSTLHVEQVENLRNSNYCTRKSEKLTEP